MTPRYAIRATCSEGTRHWWWVGVCPMAGRVIWSGDRSRAVRFAVWDHAHAFIDALYRCGSSHYQNYAVVDLDAEPGAA